jgi:hypothetical protein
MAMIHWQSSSPPSGKTSHSKPEEGQADLSEYQEHVHLMFIEINSYLLP